jgi:hypothetical protein
MERRVKLRVENIIILKSKENMQGLSTISEKESSLIELNKIGVGEEAALQQHYIDFD